MNTMDRVLGNVPRLKILCRLEQVARSLLRAALKPGLAIKRWNRVKKDSRALLNMSDHLLKDIGLTRDDLVHWRRKDIW